MNSRAGEHRASPPEPATTAGAAHSGDNSAGDSGAGDSSAGAVGAVENIDWGLAATIGKRIARPGPKVTRYTAQRAHQELTEAAVRAESPVREVTGLADGLAVPTAQILDRAGWIEAAARSMPAMLGPDDGSGVDGGHGITGKLAGAQAGGMLAFLSGSILGQYDPFTPDPETGEPGVLMLVAPNIIAVERQLHADPSDFRLWVCLHEVTHRVQFSASPWLPDYMRTNVGLLSGGDDESTAEMVGRIMESLRSGRPRDKGVIGLMQLVQSPEQFEAFERVLALGTLLEGHADHVMDAVGPAYVPTVETIRAAFDHRRASSKNPLQRLVRALFGIDAKIAQYVRGKAFVDQVVGEVGMERFNTVWTSPETLPLMAEFDQPDAWIERVL